MGEVAKLKCGCVLVRYDSFETRKSDWFVDSLCDKHKADYYKDSWKVVVELRKQITIEKAAVKCI